MTAKDEEWMCQAKPVSEMSLSLNRVLRITISFLYLYVIIFIALTHRSINKPP